MEIALSSSTKRKYVALSMALREASIPMVDLVQELQNTRFPFNENASKII